MGRGGEVAQTVADRNHEDTFVLPAIPSQDDRTKDPEVSLTRVSPRSPTTDRPILHSTRVDGNVFLIL